MTPDGNGTNGSFESMLGLTTRVDMIDDDITGGVPNDPENCPIARAIKRVTGRTSVRIGEDTQGAVIINGAMFKIPEFIKEFVDKFDNGEHPEPIDFALTGLSAVPDEVPVPGSPVYQTIQGEKRIVPGLFNK